MENCCFTGHRRIAPEHINAIDNLVLRSVDYAYKNGCRNFYAGGAVGFDTVAAKAVLLFKISHPDVRLILLLPCVDQEKSWSQSQKSTYYYILRSADEIEYVSEEYTASCMRQRNAALAERADIMIAYCVNHNSGAGQTVRMAQRLGKTVYNIYPALDRETNQK